MRVRTWMTLTAGAVLAVCVVATAVNAADDDAKAARDAVMKIAGMVEKGKMADAKKEGAGVKSDLEDIMNLMLPRKGADKGGIGVGDKPGAIVPDGIEKKLQDLEKNAPKADEAKALEKSAYIILAIAAASENKIPKGKKGPWKKYSADFEKTAQGFLEATKKGDAKGIQAAAKTLNNACIACHNDFK
jgi:cytochrome c556